MLSCQAYLQIKDLPLDESLIYRSEEFLEVHRDSFDCLIAAHLMQSRCTVIPPDAHAALLGALRLW